MDLFIPGRLCLFGEHSDWAAQYRQVDSNIDPGYAIVVGTNQGISAKVQVHHSLRFKTVHQPQILELAMDETLLLGMAKTDNFYSYGAGVAYEALKRYGVGGIDLDNYEMDLPLKKGLSSSAAICVLVARAFNKLYGLGLTIKEEMDLAYCGERHTPSQCGRLDQACAYGNQPILMTFAGDSIEIKPLNVGQDLYLAIADLAGNKDTQKILASLNQCYPLADNEMKTTVHKYLSQINADIVKEAVSAIEQGDAAQIGNLMNYAQQEFDRCLMPVCKSELTAPILHRLLNHKTLQGYIHGAKGVGSQGDGTAQLIAGDCASRKKAISIIEQDFPQMHCYKLNIPKTRTIDNN